MATGTQSPAEPTSDRDPHRAPEITVRESCPGKSVFLERENTDGWIASDLTVGIVR